MSSCLSELEVPCENCFACDLVILALVTLSGIALTVWFKGQAKGRRRGRTPGLWRLHLAGAGTQRERRRQRQGRRRPSRAFACRNSARRSGAACRRLCDGQPGHRLHPAADAARARDRHRAQGQRVQEQRDQELFLARARSCAPASTPPTPTTTAIENQIPDIGNTFSTAWFRIPAGAKIVVKGDFPHMRHWSFVTYSEKRRAARRHRRHRHRPRCRDRPTPSAPACRAMSAAPLHLRHRQRHPRRHPRAAQHGLHAGRTRHGDRHAHAQLRARPQRRLDRWRGCARGRTPSGRRQGAGRAGGLCCDRRRRGAASKSR